MPSGHRDQLERLFADQRAQREQWMAQLPAELRALLPLDATPIVQGMTLLADAVGIGEQLQAAQREQSHANSAVLHGRVFGRGAPLSQETALAAFADGARVREPLLLQLAAAVDGGELRDDVAALLTSAPIPAPQELAGATAATPGDLASTDAPAPDAAAALGAVFAAQERALLRCAERLDAI
ncbi:MAG TPA: hypothetical protein VLK58_12195 [Conexibacter sp.]|nr:hypothetical protein [Conexibacter sp.]